MTTRITRLFVSADIAGSTAYKQQKRVSEAVAWPSVFIKFFQGLPELFREELDTANAQAATMRSTHQRGADPVLWKAIGDELVFWQEVSTELQVTCSVVAWTRAMRRCRDGLAKQGLDVKGAAWLATFPYPNREIAIPRVLSVAVDPGEPITYNENRLSVPDMPDHFRDFIGQHIDTGFRVAARSTVRQMAVALEIVDVVSHAPNCPELKKDLRLFYAGTEVLKGVHGSRPYPMFWIDCHEEGSFSSAEDKLTGRKSMNEDDLRNACTAALAEFGSDPVWLASAENMRFQEATVLDEQCKAIETHCVENPEAPPDDGGNTDQLPASGTKPPSLDDVVAALRRNALPNS